MRRAVAIVTCGLSRLVGAQTAHTRALVTIDSPLDERARVDALLGSDTSGVTLIRSASVLTRALRATHERATVIGLLPDVGIEWNSRLPWSGNDGVLWAGRGVSALARAGVAAHVGPLTVVLAPEVSYARNLGFEVMPGREPGRSTYSSPWHTGAMSADLPLRFGDATITQASLGQSSIALTLGAASVGAATENLWWGPSYRNALVMSGAAEGVPHLFVRTARPIATRAGDVEARVIAGGLTESRFFDTIPDNDYRSLSGFVVTLRPRFDRALTFGAARTVVGPARSRAATLRGAADAVARWTGPDSAPTRDQLLSLFARWAPLGGGIEIYGEWAREDLPRSLRELFIAPQLSQAFTIGASRAVRVHDGALRVLLELSDLEQSRVLSDRPQPRDYYTGVAAPQGYTQRGQPLGAAIGPGASGEYLALDYYARRWQLGLDVGRTRYENDALYRQPLDNLFRHDVGVYGGLRAGIRIPGYDVGGEATLTHRMNYLFQNGAADIGEHRTVDVHSLHLSLRVSPR